MQHINEADIDFESLSNEQLVILAKDGNETSVCVLIKRMSDVITKSISLYIDNTLESDDMEQEAKIALLNAVKYYDSRRNSSFRTFAAVCINNRLLNFIKSKNSKKMIFQSGFSELKNSDYESNEGSESSNPENIFICKEQYDLLGKMIENLLSGLEYSVFECILEGMTYEETAKKLDLNFKSVDNAMQRVRKKLKDILK